MNLPFFIARRYLFAKKSHNVINIISAISAIGMAIGTAALVIILSVYNGFDSLVRSNLGNVEPDILITPAAGKTFVPEGEAFDWADSLKGIKSICGILQETVFIKYGNRQGIAEAKGVDSIYEKESPINGHMQDGKFSLHEGDIPLAAVGSGLAYRMEMNQHFTTPIEIFYPDRKGNISVSNPISSVNSVNIFPSGTFSINSEIDNSLMIIPIEKMRELLGYENEVSAVEIRIDGQNQTDLRKIIRGLESRLGKEFKVSDRFGQNVILYRMMKYEKGAIYLILMFIIIIIAFNIFGSLSMLIIEKKSDIGTMLTFGAEEKQVREIFILEGWMISLTGLAAGMIIGIAFALAQQHFGFIKMPGNFIITSYPVILRWSDLLIIGASVAFVGYLIALLSVRSNKTAGLFKIR
ncbi:MAG: FtsX-like permease family protein [Bacteroidales bacterium]|jgi:ABC-type lipoprotein release transport system permease subunit|nr:FtsX-like permease family protein [Bacteroidales bacterium]MCI1785859.1 FtsX-like permease family protein [Bacteroidales bacterium]